MLVRKSTNGETWVQHVLEGLVSTWAGERRAAKQTRIQMQQRQVVVSAFPRIPRVHDTCTLT